MGWFARAARLKTLPVALWPVAFGLAYGGANGGAWSAQRATAALSATALLHVGAALGADLLDQRSGAAKIARMERSSVPVGSGALLDEKVSLRAMLLLVAGSFGAATGLWLAAGDGAALGIAGVALAIPIPRVPAGLAEVLQALGRAGLPCAAAAAALDGGRPARVAAAAAIPTALAFASLVVEGLLQWRADRAVHRRTLAARAESDRALFVAGGTLSLVFAAIVAEVALEILRPWTLAALIAAVPLAGAWGRAYRDPAPQHMLRLLGACLGAGLLAGTALTVATAAT